MCGRFNLIATESEIIEHFCLPCLPDYQPDYNIPPGQKIIAVVKLDNSSNSAVNLHWGLIPSWSKDPKIARHTFNAKAETLNEKPSFRQAYQQRRCLIPATGFYEWQVTEGDKQPYYIHQPDNALFAFAGLWDYWEDQQKSVYSCTIITTVAQAKIKTIHDRMPVIIKPDFYDCWLDKSNTVNEIADYMDYNVYQTLQLTPIGLRINSPLHNDKECLREEKR